MSGAQPKLSIAFVWHMHQPEYKDDLTGEYLMPWTRLHAIKDYLDMVVILEKHPKIRQTFNLVPSLIDQLEDYCKPETQDRHLKLMLQNMLSDDDKQFILQRFFDANIHTMISRSARYYSLWERRNQVLTDAHTADEDDEEILDVSRFSNEEYSDMMSLFHLVWTDPLWFKKYPELEALWEKQSGYTLEDRKQIIELQRNIICEVLSTYKAFQQKGQIEITTTPYYHPILPLLIDTDSAKVAMPSAVMPEDRFIHPEDASWHVREAQRKYRDVFEQPARGVWPSEQSISPDAVRMLKSVGHFSWGISSEGNLAHSTNIPIEKDPYGNVMNVEVFCRPYRYESLNMIFRDLTLSDLIGFHYATMPAEQAVNDLIFRLKQLQSRCADKGMKYPIATIALDGENCWESYPEDGHQFLNLLYQRLSEDDSLNVCTVSEYFDSLPDGEIRQLEHLHSGSWIYSNFHVWIADPVKNAGWTYLTRTRNDLEHFSKTGHYSEKALEMAWKEIYIAEGSDWFWWYGEPNHSGQDDLFDMQFRQHLGNVYRVLGLEIPNYLSIPLTVTMGRPVTPPMGCITPVINGLKESNEGWSEAGCLDLTHGAMHRATRILNKVYFCADEDYAYFQFDLNLESVTPFHEIYLYICTPGKTRHNSPVRLKSASFSTVACQRFHYAYEIQIGSINKGQLTAGAAEAIPDHLWQQRTDIIARVAFQDVLELAVKLDPMGVHMNEYLQFTVALVQGDVLEEMYPAQSMISLQRPDTTKLCEIAPVTPVHVTH